MAAMRPSKQIRNDEDLSWEEMMDAKNVMLHFMAKSGVWQDEHVTALATFYINLDYHQRKEQKNGKPALLLYQSQVRREWYNALKHDEGFNIMVIEEDLLRALAEEVNNSIQDRENAVRDRELDQVRLLGISKTTRLADEVRSPFPPSFPLFRLSFLFRTLHIMCHTMRSPLPFATCQLPFAVFSSALCYALAMTLPGDYTPAMTPPGDYTPTMTSPGAYTPALTVLCSRTDDETTLCPRADDNYATSTSPSPPNIRLLHDQLCRMANVTSDNRGAAKKHRGRSRSP